MLLQRKPELQPGNGTALQLPFIIIQVGHPTVFAATLSFAEKYPRQQLTCGGFTIAAPAVKLAAQLPPLDAAWSCIMLLLAFRKTAV